MRTHGLKQSFWTFLLLLAFSAAALKAAPVKICILLKDRSAFWQAAEQGALAAAAKEPGFQVIIKAPPATHAPNQQSLMLKALLKEEPAVLVIAPLAADLFATEIAALKAKGTKIVALDTNLAENLADVFIGHNQEAMAQEAGQVFAKLVGAANSGGILRPNSSNAALRERTFIKSFKAAAPSALLYLDIYSSSDNDGQSNVILEKHPEMKAVATLFTGTSLAMSRSIQDRGVAGKIKHLGFGTGLPPEVVSAINSDTMHVWVAQVPKLMGQRGVEIAVMLAQGKTHPAILDLPYLIVTKENLPSPEVNSLRD